eukprot:10188279-Alexandrium_andersonii.AAC.1
MPLRASPCLAVPLCASLCLSVPLRASLCQGRGARWRLSNLMFCEAVEGQRCTPQAVVGEALCCG